MSTSPPSIYRDVVMIQDNGPNVQAYDARTGSKLWQTELIAQPGDPNHATWLNDSWNAQVGGTDVWGIMSIDPDRGLLFAPVSKTGNDYWGGPHHGNNLYSDSVVAIDAQDRQDRLALPDGPSRHLGFRSRRRADTRRRAPQRSSDSCRCPDHQDGSAVRAATARPANPSTASRNVPSRRRRRQASGRRRRSPSR